MYIGPSNRIQHVIELARMHVDDIFLILHLLNHIIDAGLLKIALPEFKNPLVSPFDSLLSEMHCGLSRVMALK